MPKRIEEAKIALLDCPLEVEKTEFDAKINIESPEQMKGFLKAEEDMLRDMVDKIAKAGANVVICQKGIDDLAQFFLAKKGILAIRRVKASDMEKLSKATGGTVVTNIEDLTSDVLGYAKLVEEQKIEDDKWTFIKGCKNPKSVTILIRGGSEKIVDEAERSMHDALCVVKDVVEEPKVVAGGGAPEVGVAQALKKHAEKLSGREQLAMLAFAEALESVPMILAENAGLDPLDSLIELRAAHEKGNMWAGVDAFSGKIRDMDKLDIYEPLSVKRQALKSACEAATMILRIDDVIAAARMKPEEKAPKPGEEGGFEE
jgi:chaperonin GroEL (HSP60 family)